jgi:hypothetical protein
MAFPALLAQADRAVLSMGGPVTYETSAEELIVVPSGIFDAAYVVANAGEAGVSSSTPAVFLRLADLVGDDGRQVDPAADDEATVTVGGTAYTVDEVKTDGMGGVVLLLHRA